jgi:hypothetical protein
VNPWLKTLRKIPLKLCVLRGANVFEKRQCATTIQLTLDARDEELTPQSHNELSSGCVGGFRTLACEIGVEPSNFTIGQSTAETE